MPENKISIRIEAKDDASKVIKQITDQVEALSQKFGELSEALLQVKSTFTEVLGGIEIEEVAPKRRKKERKAERRREKIEEVEAVEVVEPEEIEASVEEIKEATEKVEEVKEDLVAELEEWVETKIKARELGQQMEETVKVVKDAFTLKGLEGDALNKVKILGDNLNTVIDNLGKIREEEYAPSVIRGISEFGLQVESFGKELKTIPGIAKNVGKSLEEAGKQIWQKAEYLRFAVDSTGEYEEALKELENDFNNLGETLGQIGLRLEQNTIRNVKRAGQALREISRDLYSTGKTLAIAGGVITGFFSKILYDLGRYALETEWYSKRIGLSAQETQALQVALKYSNTTMQQFSTSIAVLSRKLFDAGMSSGVATKALKMLHLDMFDANGDFEDTGYLLAQIIVKLQQMPNALERNAILTKIFGRENTKLVLQLLTDFEKLREEYAKAYVLGVVFSPEQQAQAVRLQEGIIELKEAFRGLFFAIGLLVSSGAIRFIEFIRNILINIRNLLESLGFLGKIIANVVLFLGMFAVIGGTLLFILGRLIREIVYLRTAMKLLSLESAVSAVLFGKIALAILAIATAITIILGMRNPFENLEEYSEKFYSDIIANFNKLKEDAREAGFDFAEAYREGMKQGSYHLKAFARQLAQDLFEYFGGGHSPALKGPLSNLEYWGAKFVDAYREGIVGRLTRVIQEIAVNLSILMETIWLRISNAWNYYLKDFQNKVSERTAKLGFDIGAGLAKALLGKGTDWRGLLFSYLTDIVKITGSTLINFFNYTRNTIIQTVDTFFNSLTQSVIKNLGLDSKEFFRSIGRGFFTQLFGDIKKEVILGINTVFNSIVIFIDSATGGIISWINNSFSLTQQQLNRLTSWLSEQLNIRQQIEFMRWLYGGKKYAHGTITDKPHIALVAEEGAEAIIPLSPNKRRRGLELWIKAGRILGVPMFAEGGITGSAKDLEDWARMLAVYLNITFENFKTGIVDAIARWERVVNEIPKVINVSRDFEIPEQKKQTQKLETISINTVNMVKALEKMLAYSQKVASLTEDEVKVLSKPANIKKVEDIVNVSEINLKGWASDFRREVEKYIKDISQDTSNFDKLLNINWSAILQQPYITFFPQIQKAVEDVRSLKIKYQSVSPVLKEYEKIDKYIDIMRKGGQINTEEFKKTILAFWNKYVLGKVPESIVPKAADINSLLEYTLNEYLQQGKVSPTGKGNWLFEHLGNVFNYYQEQSARESKSLRTEYEKSAKDTIGLLRNLISTIPLETTGTTAKPVSSKIGSKIEEILIDYIEEYLGLVFTPSTGKSQQYINEVLGFITTTGRADTNLKNLQDTTNILINNFNNLSDAYKTGQKTQEEYIKGTETLVNSLNTHITNVEKASNRYREITVDLIKWESILSEFIKLVNEGAVSYNQLRNKVSEQQFKQIESLLINLQNVQGEDFRKAVLQIFEDELENSRLIRNILEKAGREVEEQKENLERIYNEGIKIRDEPITKVKGILYDMFVKFIQGDFVGSFGTLYDYFKTQFITGIVDSLAKSQPFNRIASSITNIGQKLLKPQEVKLSDFLGLFSEMFWSFDEMNVGFRKSLANIYFVFQDLGNKAIKALQEGAEEQIDWAKELNLEQTVSLFSLPSKELAKSLENIENKLPDWLTKSWKVVKDVFNPLAWANILVKMMQLDTDTLRKLLREGGRAFFDIRRSPEKFREDLEKITGKTFSEAEKNVIVSFKDLFNKIANPVIDESQKMINQMFKAFPWMQTALGFIKPISEAILQLFKTIGNPLTALLVILLGDSIFRVVEDFLGIFQDIYNGFLKDFVLLIKQVLRPILIPIISLLATILKSILLIIQPFIPLLKLFAEVVGAIINFLGTIFITVFNVVFKPVIYVFGKAVAGVIWAIGWVINLILGWATDFGRRMMDAAEAMSDFLDNMQGTNLELEKVEEKGKGESIQIANLTGSALEAFQKLLSPLTALTRLDSYFQEMIGYLKKIADSLSNIPKLQHGGIITSPTLAWIGEGGAEAVIPLNRVNSTSNNSLIINNLNIYVDQVAELEDIESLTNAIMKYAGIRANRVKYRGGV